MISLGPMIKSAIKMLSIPVLVTDTSYTTNTTGEDVQTLLANRTIKAAVDASNSRELQNMFGGNVSDGSIGIFTTATLYIDDIYSTAATRSKQSFVEYEGFKYRVTKAAPWKKQAGFTAYLAERHITQDVV